MWDYQYLYEAFDNAVMLSIHTLREMLTKQEGVIAQYQGTYFMNHKPSKCKHIYDNVMNVFYFKFLAEIHIEMHKIME